MAQIAAGTSAQGQVTRAPSKSVCTGALIRLIVITPPYKTELQRQVNKRLSLNLLIQGAAFDAFLTVPPLVKTELDGISRGLFPLIDKLSVNLQLTHWIGELVLMFGRPKKFWGDVKLESHPFHDHPFLVKHGPGLSAASKKYAVKCAKKRWVLWFPGGQFVQTYWYLIRMIVKERHRWDQLADIAVQATCKVWGIDKDRIEASIVRDVKFGNLQPNPTEKGKFMQDNASGYSGVEHDGDQLKVIAKAWAFPLLIHELTKGVAELICIHSLNDLDEQMYDDVIRIADKIEYEISMMQAGGELWRKFISAKTDEFPLAETLMHVALLEPEDLEAFLIDLVEHPMTARATIGDWFD